MCPLKLSQIFSSIPRWIILSPSAAGSVIRPENYYSLAPQAGIRQLTLAFGLFYPNNCLFICPQAKKQKQLCLLRAFLGRQNIKFPLLYNHPPTWVGFCREYCGNYREGKHNHFQLFLVPEIPSLRYEMMIKAHLTKQEEHMELFYPTKHSGNHEGGSSRLQDTAWSDGEDASNGWSRNKFLYSQMFLSQGSDNSTGTRMTPSWFPIFQ